MSTVTTTAALDGLFYEVYASEIENLIPEVAKVVKLVPFVEKSKESGGYYNQPVIVAASQGFTYQAPGTTITLNPAVSMQMQNAKLLGSQMVLRTAMDYEAAARASTSKKAFVEGTGLIMEEMMESSTKRLEIALLYGQEGLGATSSIAQYNGNSSPTTQSLVTFSAASWAVGIWSGSENTQINFYNGSSLVSSGADAIFTIIEVNATNRTIVVEGTSGGSTTLVALTATPLTPYYRGAYGLEMAGIGKIISNTGTLFNINATTYNLWSGNTLSVTGALTMGKILAGISRAVGRGLNERVVCLINPDTWANLQSDLAAQRMFDGSYDAKKARSGAENILYYGQNGEIEVISHNCIKAGDCMIFPPRKVQRVGAQNLSFVTPGMPGQGQIFLHLQDQAAFELRLYTDQAVLIETPARCVRISGFTNQAA